MHYLLPTYGPGIDFYQSTPTNPFGEGLFTPEGLYPLTGVHTLPFNYPSGADGFPSDSTSVGQGDDHSGQHDRVRDRQRQHRHRVRLLPEFRDRLASSCRS